MPGMEWTVELILVALLAATLYQALRLERALGVLKRDRASLESLVAGFNTSTSQAESGIQQLRAAADGTGRQIENQLARSTSLKDDLAFLTERADRLADRLETLVRSARPLAQDRQGPDRPGQDRPTQGRPIASHEVTASKNASQAERDLLQALRLAR